MRVLKRIAEFVFLGVLFVIGAVAIFYLTLSVTSPPWGVL